MPSKLKVLQVIPKLGYGGAETGCYDIAHYLYENDCQSYIITSGGELTKFVKKKKVKLIRLPVQSKNPLIMLINALLISLIILFLNINIVHARSRAPAWSCLLATKITRRKFVTTFHGTYNFKSKIKKFYNSVMLRSDLIIVKSWQLQVGKKVILMPGRLTFWKGQEIFLEALNKVNIQLGNETFIAVILGSDQGRSLYKKKLIRLSEQHRLNKQIIFIDNCKNMPLAYKISDFVVSASIEPEAFGRVSVEAQSMQKLILASNIGGSKETIIDNKTGLLFEASNSDDLSKKIIEAMNLEENTLKQMGIEGRKNAIKKFNVEKMCFSTYSEYKKLFN